MERNMTEETGRDCASQNEELAMQLERALKEAARNRDDKEALREELQQFIYAASHDLQEPLREIKVYSQLLARECTNNPQAIEFLGFVEGGVQKMTSLIQALLRYSRTGDNIRPALIDLNTMVLEAQVKLSDQIRQTAAEVRIAQLPEVVADAGQIAQVFEQLLKNALQYRGESNPVIEVSGEELGELARISVKDNGPGIEPKYQQQIFLPFKRLHGRENPGTGLGLAIARKVIRANGGDIWVESDGQNGSTFKFTLPL
jgi:light-regulated signal transduction histidine kinase (bacteriophytochrome)